MRRMSKRIPYTVIGGYLGAGKTTLLNHLLRHSDGLRLAILVNDFGDINIDADLIVSHEGETMNLANGCICCSLADGFMTALGALRERADQIDHIIVEASGVSDPLKIGRYGTMLHFDLDAVIVLADAEQVREKAVNKYVGETVIRQLQGADLIVLNKIDLVSMAERTAVRAWLAGISHNARLVETTFGRLPAAVLLGRYETERHAVEAGHDHDHAHKEAYQTWSFTSPQALDETVVVAFLDELPPGILRAKGPVHLSGEAQHSYLLQLVGRRWSLTRGEPWAGQSPQTTLVFIGLPGSIDPMAILSALFAQPETPFPPTKRPICSSKNSNSP